MSLQHWSLYPIIQQKNITSSRENAFTCNDQVNTVEFCKVPKYECLYNRSNKDYKNERINVNCWRKIGEKFGITPEDAVKKFKNTRTGQKHVSNRSDHMRIEAIVAIVIIAGIAFVASIHPSIHPSIHTYIFFLVRQVGLRQPEGWCGPAIKS